MSKINLNLATGNRAAEIFQSLEIKFAFTSKIDDLTYNQLHLAIKCRDFLGDCIWSGKVNKPASIYNFSFDAKNTPLDMYKLRMSLKFPSKESKAFFKKNIGFIHVREDMLGIEHTKIITTNKPLTYIIESDSIWQSAVWKISLFTFYLKLISYKDTTLLEDPEDKYFKELMYNHNEEKLLKQVHNHNEILANSINTAHNNSGFLSIIQNRNKVMNQILLGDNE